MGRVDIHGIGLNVEVTGAGPALLLLHGFTGSIANWHAHIPIFAEHATVIALDVIGHGDSDAPADAARYGMGRCVEDILGVLDRLGVRQTTVLGYSMGARTALHLAHAAPDRVSTLILESGSPGLATEQERAARRAADEALADYIERDGIAAFVSRWEQNPLFSSQAALPPAVQAALHAQRLRNKPIGLAHSLRGMGTGAQASLWEHLGELDQPSLLIVGDLDTKFREIGRAMVEVAGYASEPAMPHARVAVVPAAGHAAHLEQPGAFDALVVNAISSINSRRYP